MRRMPKRSAKPSVGRTCVFVPMKTRESQGLLTLHRVRSLLVRQRTATVNAARGLLSEFRIVAAKGIRRVDDLRLAMERTDESVLPREARTALDELFGHLDVRTAKLTSIDQDILAWQKKSEASLRLATAPGVGPLTATALIAAVGDASQFRSARHFAARLGLTPRVSASGNREHIGRISKGGDRYLRTLLIHGARAMVGTSFRRGVRPRPGLQALIARRPVNAPRWPSRTRRRARCGPCFGGRRRIGIRRCSKPPPDGDRRRSVRGAGLRGKQR